MKKSKLILPVLLILYLSGCGTMPMTAAEFRTAIPGAMLGKYEVIEVKRSYKKVRQAFKKMAPKCLNKIVTTTSRTSTGYGVGISTTTTIYKATIVAGGKRTELHLQEHIEGTIKVHEEPKGGYYSLVVDASPVGKKKTRLDIYGPSIGKKVLVNAIKGWASGKVKGCPDLTKL